MPETDKKSKRYCSSRADLSRNAEFAMRGETVQFRAFPLSQASGQPACAIIGSEICRVESDKAGPVARRSTKFPGRPEPDVLSNNSIPLFFIAQNKVALWIAREAEGRRRGRRFCGGRGCQVPVVRRSGCGRRRCRRRVRSSEVLRSRARSECRAGPGNLDRGYRRAIWG